jgi:hypothetical protein
LKYFIGEGPQQVTVGYVETQAGQMLADHVNRSVWIGRQVSPDRLGDPIAMLTHRQQLGKSFTDRHNLMLDNLQPANQFEKTMLAHRFRSCRSLNPLDVFHKPLDDFRWANLICGLGAGEGSRRPR